MQIYSFFLKRKSNSIAFLGKIFLLIPDYIRMFAHVNQLCNSFNTDFHEDRDE